MIASVAAAVVTLGGGAVAMAATQGSGPGSHPGYGYGGYGAPGGSAGPAVRTPHLDGTVTTVTSSAITIKDRDGFTRTINITSTTKYSGGLTAAPAVGVAISATGSVDKDGTSLDALSITKDTGPAGGPAMGGGGPRGGAPAA
jgi:hypothetical protein